MGYRFLSGELRFSELCFNIVIAGVFNLVFLSSVSVLLKEVGEFSTMVVLAVPLGVDSFLK